MKILITGATGFIGRTLVEKCLAKGFAVNYLTSSKEKLSVLKGCDGFYWNTSKNKIDSNCFEGVNAIIHLAGASVSKRWTNSYKQKILSSRIDSTRLLVQALKTNKHEVKHIISASAIGIYPSSLINFYDESEEKIGTSFLANAVKQWEQEVDKFKEQNILVSKIRIGLVLSSQEGALSKMLPPFKYGLGSALGNGKQWQSWIHIDDLVDIFLYVLKFKLNEVYNAVAPNAVTNSEFTKTLANVLDSPLWLPRTPKFVLRLLLGEMHQLLFLSQRVSSKKIEDKGFNFKYYKLKAALKHLLK